MSTEKLLDEALERIKPYIVERLDSGIKANYRGEEDYNYFGFESTTATVSRLRLDWELSDELAGEVDSNDKIADMMLGQSKYDLLELIEDGDTSITADPLLKVLDGAKKRGKEPVLIDIFAAELHIEVRETKRATEYTLYILLAIQWAS